MFLLCVMKTVNKDIIMQVRSRGQSQIMLPIIVPYIDFTKRHFFVSERELRGVGGEGRAEGGAEEG